MHYLMILVFLLFSGLSEADELWTKYDLPYSIDCITSYGDFIWAGTDSGLIKLKRQDGSTKIYTTNDGLPSNLVTSICVDNNGIIYAGLRDIDQVNGNLNAYILSINGEKITDYSENSGLRNEIFYPEYYTTETVSFIDNFNNNIYFAINNSSQWGHFSTYKIALIEFDNINWNIVFIQSLVSQQYRLFIYNMFFNPYNLIYHYTLITNNSQGKVKNILYDKTGQWNTYFSSKFVDYMVDSDTTRFTPENSSISGIVNVITIDNVYTKWFGCNNKTSLVSFDNVSWKSFKHADWTDGTIIKLLNIDEDNDVWVVTSNPSGLYRLNPAAITAVESAHQFPAEFTLSSPYPNPFNAQTTISFTLNKPAKVNLSIYSLTGQKVRELATGNYTTGKHTLTWDGKNEKGETVSSGLYLARMESGGISKVVRMAMVK